MEDRSFKIRFQDFKTEFFMNLLSNWFDTYNLKDPVDIILIVNI